MNENLPAPKFAPLEFRRISPDEQRQNTEKFYESLNRRRTVRDFSDEAVTFEIEVLNKIGDLQNEIRYG